MKSIASSCGFNTTSLITSQAVASAVLKEIALASSSLQSGDIFLLTFSGHGGQIPDVNGDEGDGLDETWVCFDRMLVDDELYAMWGKFQPGVRIVMVSDSCHSGTIAKDAFYIGMTDLNPALSRAYRGMTPGLTHQISQGFGPVQLTGSRFSTPLSGGGC
jgi:hypothetical protein